MKQKESKALLIVGILFLVVFFVLLIFLIRYYLDYRTQTRLSDEINILRQADIEAANQNGASQDGSGAKTADGKKTDEGTKGGESLLYKRNRDYIGFLDVPDTDIFYPVVQKDNEYYLTHDFDLKKSSHGAIFLDESCDLADAVLLIHGHHMKDGTMFAQLKGYKKKEFREAHTRICFDKGFGEETYRVFAVILLDLTREDCFDYVKLPKDAKEYEEYLKGLQKNALWTKDAPEDQKDILILSTCEYGTDDQRLLVAAVRE